MEACKPIEFFFNAIQRDGRIGVTHIGIFASLIRYWQIHDFENPIHAYAHEIMGIAKISAPATYHKCIRDLHDFGYILYKPSFKRNRPSCIYLKTENNGQLHLQPIYNR